MKALGTIPLPSSLAGLFGGSGATVGGGVAMKAAVLATGAMVATGVSYESVKHGAFDHRLLVTPVAAKAHRPVARPPAAAAVIPVVLESSRDQKPAPPAGGQVGSRHREHVVRGVARGHAEAEAQRGQRATARACAVST